MAGVFFRRGMDFGADTHVEWQLEVLSLPPSVSLLLCLSPFVVWSSCSVAGGHCFQAEAKGRGQEAEGSGRFCHQGQGQGQEVASHRSGVPAYPADVVVLVTILRKGWAGGGARAAARRRREPVGAMRTS